MKPKTTIIILALVLTCGASCSDKCLGINQPPPTLTPASRTDDSVSPSNANQKPHMPFRVGRLLLSGKSVTVDSWRMSDEIVNKPVVKVAVAASWCPHCQNYIAQLGRYAPGKCPVDFIIFYEDEVSRYLDGMEENGKITSDQRDAIDVELYSRNQSLLNPEPIAYYQLDYYFIEPGEFSDLVTGYPTLLSCDANGCEKIKR